MRMNSFNPPNRAAREGLSPSPHHDENAEAQRGQMTCPQSHSFQFGASTSALHLCTKMLLHQKARKLWRASKHCTSYKGKMSESRARREKPILSRAVFWRHHHALKPVLLGLTSPVTQRTGLIFLPLRHFELGFCPCVRTQVPFRRAVVWEEDVTVTGKAPAGVFTVAPWHSPMGKHLCFF